MCVKKCFTALKRKLNWSWALNQNPITSYQKWKHCHSCGVCAFSNRLTPKRIASNSFMNSIFLSVTMAKSPLKSTHFVFMACSCSCHHQIDLIFHLFHFVIASAIRVTSFCHRFTQLVKSRLGLWNGKQLKRWIQRKTHEKNGRGHLIDRQNFCHC